MVPTRFPPEIWGRIFEHYFQPMRAPGTGGMLQTVRAIALGKVCTTWKAISEPYVYRTLNFYDETVSGLERAAYALRLPARSDKVSRWTRTFSLYLLHTMDDRLKSLALEAATAIVLHARQLVELSVFCYATPHGLLAAVAAVAPTSLRCLNLSWEASGPLALIISCIGSLSNLQTLTLTPIVSQPVILHGIIRLDEVAHWKLHNLENLVIDMQQASEDSDDQTMNQLLRFLSRCILGRPTRLSLTLMGLSLEDTNAVEELLRHHIVLSQCHLMGTPDVVNSALSFVDTRYVRLHIIPWAHAATTLSPRLRTLCIRNSSTTLEVEQLKAFMVALEKHHRDDAEPLQIHVQCETLWSAHHARTSVPFRWMPRHSSATVTKEEHAHVEWMRLCAGRLQARGIDVLDYAGYTFNGSRFELPEAEC